MERGIVIIGAGHGGSQVGFSLRQEGYDGPIRLLAEEAELPYHKPPLSKAFLKDATQEAQVLRAERAYQDARITLGLGRRVEAIDRGENRLMLADGSSLAYDRLVIATGASNRALSVPGHDLAGIFSLRTITDARALRAAVPAASSVVVIGGGFIGLEAAATFATLGKTVTVVELAPAILGRAVSPTVAAHVHAEFRKLGIDVLTDTAVESIEGKAGQVRAVRLGGGALPADLILVGIGAVPNDNLAREAGLACENGILVDADMRTSDPDVFAIGDVANFPQAQSGRRFRLESVQNASGQAKHVAKVIAGNAPGPYADIPWFWSDQGAMKLQMVGLPFGTERRLTIGDPSTGAFSVYHLAEERLVAVESVCRPGDHMMARRLLSAGRSASEADLLAGPDRLKAIADHRA